MPGPSPAIANQFFPLAQRAGNPLTNMRIQKLVFIAHGWSLAINDQPLTIDDPEAWDYGPVYRDLYKSLRDYGSNYITRPILYSDYLQFADNNEAVAPVTQQEQQLITAVWENYGHFRAFQLSALTHVEGSPWSRAYAEGQNTVIGRQGIREFFLRVALERGQEAAPAFA